MSLRCTLCDDYFDEPTNLRDHISMTHLGWLRFQCLYCPTFTNTKEQMMEHNQNRHPYKPNRISEDHHPVKAPKLQEIFQRCLEQSSEELLRNNQALQEMLGDGGQDVASNSQQFEFQIKQEEVWDAQNDRAYPSPQCTQSDFLSQRMIKTEPNDDDTPARDIFDSVLPSKRKKISIFKDSDDEKETHYQPSSSSSHVYPYPIPISSPCEQNLPEILDSQITKPETNIYCHLCKCYLILPTSQSKIHHVKQQHNHEIGNCCECPYCEFTTQKGRSAVKKHIRREHPKKRCNNWREIDKTVKTDSGTKEVLKLCFGKDDESLVMFEGDDDEGQDSSDSDESDYNSTDMESDSDSYSDKEEPRPRPSAAEAKIDPGGKYCVLCKRYLTTEDDGPRSHVLVNHWRKPLFSCDYCPYKVVCALNSVHLIRGHMKTKHPGMPPTYRAHEIQYIADPKFNKLLQKCFNE